MFWAFEKSIFHFVSNFWVTKLNPFSGKVRQSVKIFLNQNLGIRTFLDNGFGATLIPKTNIVGVWKEHFPVFCKYLSDEVKTIFRESEAKRSKLFKSKFSHRKLLRKCLWSYVELKKRIFCVFEKSIFQFFANFWVTKLKPFLSDEVEIRTLQWIAFEFELEIHETFNTSCLRFYSRFLTTVKMTHHVEIYKFDNFLGQSFIQKNLYRCCNCLGQVLARASLKHRERGLNLIFFFGKFPFFRWTNLVQVSPPQYTTKSTAFLC